MSARSMKVRMSGLRASDPTTLSIITQDLLRRPLIHLHEETLSDLIALSEVESLPYALRRDLLRFRDQMFREFLDLPDGPPLQGVLADFESMDVRKVPATLRATVVERGEDPKLAAESSAAFQRLVQRFSTAEPTPVEVREKVKTRVEHPHVPDSHRAPDERHRQRGSSTPSAARPKATPAAQRDTQREEWIRGDVMDRLGNYPGNGLKQAILIAGARHRAPWNDLTEEEVLSVLRQLKREEKVNFSAGRWSARGRLGY